MTIKNTPTYRGHKGIKEVLGTFPEGHVVRQLRAEDWDRGNRAGESDGQRTVQTARVKSNVWDAWRKPRRRSMTVSTQAAVDLVIMNIFQIQIGIQINKNTVLRYYILGCRC